MTSSSPSGASVVASRIRAAREHVVAEIRAGRMSLAASTAGADIDQVKVVVLAESVPGIGKVRARSVLDALGVDHATRWGELGDRRRNVVDSLRAVLGDGA